MRSIFKEIDEYMDYIGQDNDNSIRRRKAAKVQAYQLLEVRSPMWIAAFNS